MSSLQKDVAIIVPVYNESAIIAHVLTDWVTVLKQLNCSFLIQVINDGSTDHTAEICDDIAKKHPEIQVTHQLNSGHGPTLTFGYQHIQNVHWVFQVDSDNEITAESFPILWKERHHHALVIGQRQNRSFSLDRKITSWVANTVTRLLVGAKIKDVNCPFRLFHVNTFQPYFNQLPSNGLIPNILLSYIAQKKKLSIKEMPIVFQPRKTGIVSLVRFKLIRFSINAFFQYIQFILNRPKS